MTWQTFQQLHQFSAFASFAVWNGPDANAPEWPTDNETFTRGNWHHQLKSSVIILGINRVGNSNAPWDNFHSPSSTDIRLKNTFSANTRLSACSGAYMTDLLKDVRGAEVDYHDMDDDSLSHNARSLELEIQILGFDQVRPRFIIILGPKTQWWLHRLITRANLQLPTTTSFVEIYHPSPNAGKSETERTERIVAAAQLLSRTMREHAVLSLA